MILNTRVPKHTEIFVALVTERKFQDEKYGPVLQPSPIYNQASEQGPGGHELGTWLIILEKELEEAKKAIVHGGSASAKGRNSIRSELVQCAAVCMAALEQHGLEET